MGKENMATKLHNQQVRIVSVSYFCITSKYKITVAYNNKHFFSGRFKSTVIWLSLSGSQLDGFTPGGKYS